MMRAFAFTLTIVVALVAYWASEHSAPNANLPVVKADYQSCVTVLPGPLKPPTKPVLNRHVSEIV